MRRFKYMAELVDKNGDAITATYGNSKSKMIKLFLSSTRCNGATCIIRDTSNGEVSSTHDFLKGSEV